MSMKKKLVTAVTAASMLATIFGSAAMAGTRPVTVLGPIAKYTESYDHSDYNAYAVTEFNSNDGERVKSVSIDSATNNIATTETVDGVKYPTSTAHGYIGFYFYQTGTSGIGGDYLVTGETEKADLKVVSSNPEIRVGWNTANDDSCDDEPLSTFASTGIDTIYDLEADEGEYYLCIAAKTATSAAKSTISVYASKADGNETTATFVLMQTFTVTAVGPLKSLTLSVTDGYSRVAIDNSALDAWLTVVGKDAAGTVINGSSDSASNATLDLGEFSDNPTNVNENAFNFIDEETAQSLRDINDGDTDYSDADQLYDLQGFAGCEDNDNNELAGDEGKSYALKISSGTGASEVVSNAITISCTLDGSKAVVGTVTSTLTTATGADPKKANGDNLAGDLIATVTDGEGRPMGDGGVTPSFGTITLTDASNKLGLENVAGGLVAAVGGKVTVGEIDPEGISSFKRYTYTVKFADADMDDSGDDVAKTSTLTYVAVNPTTTTVVYNAARTTATIRVNFGVDGASEWAFFDVESATGKVTTYRRAANAAGVASLTISLRRTTVYVSALSDGAGTIESNLTTVTFK